MKTGTHISRQSATDVLREFGTSVSGAVDRVIDILSQSGLRLLLRSQIHASSVDAESELANVAGVNLLLMGPSAATHTLVDRLRPLLPAPVLTVQPGQTHILMDSGPLGTLVLEDIEVLGLAEQWRLLAWLNGNVHGPRVISTASRPVMPLINRGLFLENLYYRLNTVYVEMYR